MKGCASVVVNVALKKAAISAHFNIRKYLQYLLGYLYGMESMQLFRLSDICYECSAAQCTVLDRCQIDHFGF